MVVKLNSALSLNPRHSPSHYVIEAASEKLLSIFAECAIWLSYGPRLLRPDIITSPLAQMEK